MLLRYFVVSAMALSIDYAVYFGLVLAQPSLALPIAAAAGYIVGAIMHYWASRRFVFAPGWLHKRRAAEFTLFLASGMLGAAITSGTVWAVSRTPVAGVHWPKIVAIVTSFVVVYTVRKSWVFRSRQTMR